MGMLVAVWFECGCTGGWGGTAIIRQASDLADSNRPGWAGLAGIGINRSIGPRGRDAPG